MNDGRLHALLLDGRGGASAIDDAALLRWRPEHGVLWLHFDYTRPASRCWLEQHSGLATLAIEALLAQETRPRVGTVGGGQLLNLRGVNLTPGAQPEDMIAIRLWFDGTRLISTQRRTLRAMKDVCAALDLGQGPGCPAAIVAELLDRLTWHVEEVVSQAEDRVSALDHAGPGDAAANGRARNDRGMMQRDPQMLGEITELRRQLISLRRYLGPQREAMTRLVSDQTLALPEHEALVIREAADRLQRLLEDIDLAREHASIALEDLQSRLSDRLGRRMYVIAILTGLFLPLTFVTGLFGVNLGGMPGAADEYGFLWLLIWLAALSALLAVWLRWRQWL